jgi:hypothetical protein
MKRDYMILQPMKLYLEDCFLKWKRKELPSDQYL